jgi:diacylglycerol kinase family enzyme
MIINPSASGVTARNRVVIQNAISAEHELEVSETNRRGHATRFAQGAAARGFDVVVSVGGDGTVNEVTNGLAGSPILLGVLPGGSTNVFARQLGFVNDPEGATEQLLSGLRQDASLRIGLGKVNGRYFCFHVGMGYDAAVVAQVERFGSLKRWLGHPLFAYAAVQTWLRGYDRKRPAMSVEIALAPEQPASGSAVGRPNSVTAVPLTRIDAHFAVALKLDPYSYVGPKPISFAPAATTGSALSVVALKSLGLVPILRALTMAVSGKDITKVSAVERIDGLHGFTVRGHRPFPWQVDGDYLGDTDILDFSYEPNCLSIVAPR